MTRGWACHGGIEEALSEGDNSRNRLDASGVRSGEDVGGGVCTAVAVSSSLSFEN